MRPQLSYRIWFTQRSGSTLFSEMLGTTGIAGKPGELFLDILGDTSIQTFTELCEKFWSAGSTPNGVIGVKEAYHYDYFLPMFENIHRLMGEPLATWDQHTLLADLMPNCKHIFLTRRNKIRQAVSWWKAIQDEVWHLRPGETHQNSPSFYEEKYVFDALRSLLRNINLKESAAQAYFDEHEIAPLSVVYEDFIRNPQTEIERVLQFLGIPYTTIELPSFTLKKTSNAASERWVQRFREDLQEDGERVW